MTRPGFEPEKWPVEILATDGVDDATRVARFEEGAYRFLYSILEGIEPKVPADAKFPHEESLLRELRLHHATLDLLFEGYDEEEGTIACDAKTGRKKWKRYAKADDGTWTPSADGRTIADYYLAALERMRGHWRGHPYSGSMVGLGSPHPYENFGCTVCHLGRGWSTDFGRAWHTPRRVQVADWMTDARAEAEHHAGVTERELSANRQMSLDQAMQAGHAGAPESVHVGFVPDRDQESRWEQLGRGKTELKYWSWPQHPKMLVQSSCLKCHKQGVYATPEPEYAHARIGEPVPGVPDLFEYETNSVDGGGDSGNDRLPIPAKERPYRPESLERGQDDFLRFGCYGCHKLDPAVFPLMEGQRAKVGPPLDELLRKVTAEFVPKWIRNPKDFRPDTRMPRFWGLANNSHRFRFRFADAGYDEVDGEAWANAEIFSISRFLIAESRGGAGDETVQLGDPKSGERIVLGDYEASGNQAKACIACHDVPITTPELKFDPAQVRRWTDARTRRVRGWGDRMSRQHGPSLAGIGSKVRPKWLVEWLMNPRGYWHDTNMPDLRLTEQEARDVAAYLMTLRHEEFDKLPGVAGDQGVIDRMAQELKVAERQEPTNVAVALVKAMTPEKRTLYVGRKLVAHYGCFGCHQIEAFKSATPIGTELTKWGSKAIERLEFNKAPIDHTRFDFAYTKLVNPRVYDLGMARADLPYDRLKMPRFDFTPEEARDLAVFLLALVDDPVDAASFRPDARERVLIEGRKIVRRYNCQGCHILEGKGGDLWPAIPEKNEKWRPPDLLGQGMKTRPKWLFEFLKAPYVVRPFHAIRMPTFHFTDDEARALVAYFAALSEAPFPFETTPLDGLVGADGKESPLGAPHELKLKDPADRTKEFRATVTTRLDMARAMFTEYQCKSCHSTDPSVPVKNRAPDFRHVREGRLRPEWIEMWLWKPLLLQAGTAMPTFFDKGKPQDPQFFDASAAAQVKALADYLTHHYTEKDR